jgi:hypothetical protein
MAQISQIFFEPFFPFSSCLGALGGALWIAMNRYLAVHGHLTCKILQN